MLDGNVAVEQVLQQGVVVVAGLFHAHEDLLQRRVRAETLDPGAEARAGIVERARGTALETAVAPQQRARNEACDVLVFANVDTHGERLAGHQRHRAQPGNGSGGGGAGVRTSHAVPPPVRLHPPHPTARAPTARRGPHAHPQFGRHVLSRAAFSLFFGCQKREKAWQRAKRCAASGPPAARAGRAEESGTAWRNPLAPPWTHPAHPR
jgi:hypothetical protein